MPQLRRDPTTGDWTIIAAERAERPGASRVPEHGEAERDPTCPFCPGNEDQTPPEVLRRPAGPAWVVRVVPNKYPALVPGPLPEPPGLADSWPWSAMPAAGRYEVIVEGPAHRRRLTPEHPSVLCAVLAAALDRMRSHRENAAPRYTVLFKNHGPRAGASLVHPHWQLAAAPLVPVRLARMLELAQGPRRSSSGSLYAELLERELDDGRRIVRSADGFVTLAAYAPQWPGETWVVPRDGRADVTALEERDLTSAADVLHDALERVRAAFGEPDCNVIFFSAPAGDADAGGFQWHVRIQPRLSVLGGFELASGVAIATVAPERAAELLRAARS